MGTGYVLWQTGSLATPKLRILMEIIRAQSQMWWLLQTGGGGLTSRIVLLGRLQ